MADLIDRTWIADQKWRAEGGWVVAPSKVGIPDAVVLEAKGMSSAPAAHYAALAAVAPAGIMLLLKAEETLAECLACGAVKGSHADECELVALFKLAKVMP